MTTAASPRSDTLEAVDAWVVDHLRRCQQPGALGVEDIAEVAPHPDGRLAACTLVVRTEPFAPAHRRVAVVDLDAPGRLTLLDQPYDACTRPAWSPDGSRLVLVGSTDDGASAVMLAGPPHELRVAATSDLPGFVESASWSPDGTRLALQVAMPGAGISDVHGSGTLGDVGSEAWRPRVLPAGGVGRRLAHVWDPLSGDAQVVCDRTVWELAWYGDDALLALTTEQSDENAWYGAVLTRVDLRQGRHEALLVPDDQLSVPRSSPAGRRWSVLAGLQSDRGLPAGTLLVGGSDRATTAVDTRDVHVTDQRWLDESTVLVAGLAGLQTVVATVDVDSGVQTELWRDNRTCGEYFPEVAGLAGHDPLVVLESHRVPPTLGVLGSEGFRPVLSTAGPGTEAEAAVAGTTAEVDWLSADGVSIQGLLTVPADPAGAGRQPLVVHVHGGPTHAARNTWAGRDPHTSCLVARGYAVLRPNPRGSTGRGPAFAEAVRHDMGGRDVDDVVTGVQALLERGVADPHRLGITGISYGGFMSAWVPARTGLFGASVARSPCTDWLLQHLTSNIAEFDRRFVQGAPFDPDSQYAARSPLRHAGRIRTPMLLTAGQKDLATPPSQAQVLHTALRERGVATQLVLYPEEGHGIRDPRTLADQCARMVAWFDRHLPGPAGPHS